MFCRCIYIYLEPRTVHACKAMHKCIKTDGCQCMNVANARTLAPGWSVRYLSARYPDHCSARCRLEANLDDVASGYACLCGLGQLGNCVSFYMIPSVERQREWIMHRIGQREWIMHSMYPLVGVGLSSHRAAQGRRQNRQLFRFADEDCPVRSGGADARAGRCASVLSRRCCARKLSSRCRCDARCPGSSQPG